MSCIRNRRRILQPAQASQQTWLRGSEQDALKQRWEQSCGWAHTGIGAKFPRMRNQLWLLSGPFDVLSMHTQARIGSVIFQALDQLCGSHRRLKIVTPKCDLETSSTGTTRKLVKSEDPALGTNR